MIIKYNYKSKKYYVVDIVGRIRKDNLNSIRECRKIIILFYRRLYRCHPSKRLRESITYLENKYNKK